MQPYETIDYKYQAADEAATCEDVAEDAIENVCNQLNLSREDFIEE